jgi:hypothetical protein
MLTPRTPRTVRVADTHAAGLQGHPQARQAAGWGLLAEETAASGLLSQQASQQRHACMLLYGKSRSWLGMSGEASGWAAGRRGLGLGLRVRVSAVA